MFPKNYKNCVIYTGTSRILIYFSLENPCFCHNLTIFEVIAGKFSGLLPNLTIVFAECLPKSQNVCIFLEGFLVKIGGITGKMSCFRGRLDCRSTGWSLPKKSPFPDRIVLLRIGTELFSILLRGHTDFPEEHRGEVGVVVEVEVPCHLFDAERRLCEQAAGL